MRRFESPTGTFAWIVLLAALVAVLQLFAAFAHGAEPATAGHSLDTSGWRAARETSYRQAAARHPGIVRVAVRCDDGVAYGSGTLVSRRHVLTCHHLFRGERVRQITCCFGPRGCAVGRLAKTDRAWDLALLELSGVPAGCEPVRIAAGHPKQGDPVSYAGFGAGSYRAGRGRTVGYVNVAGQSGHQNLVASGVVRDGDSGGPMLNARGELVGVVWGTDGQTVTGTYCGRVRAFLAGILSGRPEQPEVEWDHSEPPSVCGPAHDGSNGSPVPHSSISAIENRVAAIEARLEEIGSGPAGPPGKPGPPGERGPAGPQGPPGEPAKIDVDALAETVAGRIDLPDPQVAIDAASARAVAEAVAEALPRTTQEEADAGPAYYEIVPRNTPN